MPNELAVAFAALFVIASRILFRNMDEHLRRRRYIRQLVHCLLEKSGYRSAFMAEFSAQVTDGLRKFGPESGVDVCNLAYWETDYLLLERPEYLGKAKFLMKESGAELVEVSQSEIQQEVLRRLRHSVRRVFLKLSQTTFATEAIAAKEAG